ncbi:MAG: tetraacyldisaccharide 4'-kinase, partial [Bacteroidetes bacterium]
HYFTESDLHVVRRRFEAMPEKGKMILTTEKDATRLELLAPFIWEHQLPIYVLPAEVEFCDNDEDKFQAEVRRFLLDFKV